MAKYVAFLRAVNVGGRTVKMDVLKELFIKAGFKQVKTYIQSGNVIFESGAGDTPAMEAKIEKLLLQELGFEVPTCIRSFGEMADVVKNNPFNDTPPDDEVQVYIAFLRTIPGPDTPKILQTLNNAAETYHLSGKDIYIKTIKNLMQKPFSNVNLEKKTGVISTTRNLATATKVIL
ncbi:MAG TPA: DUF1697 domain-containing protein [Chitinophaga sp.]|uniref:DUF1697 domain-containing protein n=1 Tax=Chitinophaga sp. TaxID=1869181 RepID=UPI002CE61CE1|nr:DUF1697 domain-containing protein [Chitinophaga sp.]HVI48089.1 DUF1697 domain-containing protein [Chitinophaga sp.]